MKIASIEGLNNPVAIIEDEILNKLYAEYKIAQKNFTNGDEVNVIAIADVLSTLKDILELYSKNRNKYYSGLGSAGDELDALNTLVEAARALDAIQNPRK